MQEYLQLDIAGIVFVIKTEQSHLFQPILERFGLFARMVCEQDIVQCNQAVSGDSSTDRLWMSHQLRVNVTLSQQIDIQRMLSWSFHYEPSAAAAFGIASNVLPSRQKIQRHADGSVEIQAASYAGHWDGCNQIHLTLFSQEVAHSLEGFLLGVLPDLLLSLRACFLHTSGLVSRDRAYLFTGPSGSGKTTVVIHSPNKTILSDELVVVRYHDTTPVYRQHYVSWAKNHPTSNPTPDPTTDPTTDLGLLSGEEHTTGQNGQNRGQLWAYGTPFFGSWGKPGVPVAAPIQNIHFLSKALEHRLESLSPRESFRRLCGVVCYRQPHAKVVESLLALVDRMIPLCGLLHFYPSPDLWNLVEGV